MPQYALLLMKTVVIWKTGHYIQWRDFYNSQDAWQMLRATLFCHVNGMEKHMLLCSPVLLSIGIINPNIAFNILISLYILLLHIYSCNLHYTAYICHQRDYFRTSTLATTFSIIPAILCSPSTCLGACWPWPTTNEEVSNSKELPSRRKADHEKKTTSQPREFTKQWNQKGLK